MLKVVSRVSARVSNFSLSVWTNPLGAIRGWLVFVKVFFI